MYFYLNTRGRNMDQKPKKPGLAEVISALREELNTAKQNAENEDIRFNINNVEIELQTVVEMEGGVEGGGKIKFWVLDIDAKASGKYKNAVTQKIKLSLQVVDESKPAVNGQSPLAQIGGDS